MEDLFANQVFGIARRSQLHSKIVNFCVAELFGVSTGRSVDRKYPVEQSLKSKVAQWLLVSHGQGNGPLSGAIDA